MNSTLVDWLSSDASGRVHVQVSHRVGVGVRDPRHLALAGAHVRSWNIDAGPQESFLSKFDGETTSHPLELVVGIDLGVDAESGLSSSEGDVDAGALVGHQRGQGLDLVGADVQRITDASLAWGAMVRMLKRYLTKIFHLTT